MKRIFLIHKDNFDEFSNYFEIVNEGESKDLESLLKQEWATAHKA